MPITVVADDGTEETMILPTAARLDVVDGQEVKAGDPIVDGPRDPKELMEIKGVRETQLYLVEEVQKVYRDQGVSIHDKHIELIVRQMTRRIGVQEPGDTDFLPGERVDQKVFRETNKRMVEDGSRAAEGRPELMGITKASLATDSWLSAASFQETTRVLTEAAIDGRGDNLVGLKENIIIGKLIPAGTGMPRYREFDVRGAGVPAHALLLVGRSRSGRVAGQHLGLVHGRNRRRRRGGSLKLRRAGRRFVGAKAADRRSRTAADWGRPSGRLLPFRVCNEARELRGPTTNRPNPPTSRFAPQFRAASAFDDATAQRSAQPARNWAAVRSKLTRQSGAPGAPPSG